MTILITNDDGIHAPGIKAITELALEFADKVVVVAPDKCYSGMSHSITMHSPLFLECLQDETFENGKKLQRYSLTGAPVDCVKFALDEILKEEGLPDMLFSGINHGSNSNISIIYSGTMGAATEGAFYGIPSIGFSLMSHDEKSDLTPTLYYARKIIEKALTYPSLTPTLCWNVNVPHLKFEEIKGIRFARQTVGVWKEDFARNQDPRGRNYYWMRGRFENQEPGAENSDEKVLSDGYISIVPVQMDMTNYTFLESEGFEF